jgi:SAM-dependent methyltransferase
MLTESDLYSRLANPGGSWQKATPPPPSTEAAPEYFSHPRPDVIVAVPETARRIVELGCGAGVVGAAIKERQACSYVGIEMSPVAAALAARTLDAVLIGDVEAAPLPFPDGSADCVVCADILEHLADPWQMLAELHRILEPGGTIVASVPNIQNVEILQALVQGRWDYHEAGILDRTHLRFFTRSTFGEALLQAGFVITACNFTMLPQHAAAINLSDSAATTVKLGRMTLDNLSEVDRMELVAYQWIFVASAAPANNDIRSA